ncbi:MAG TPA: carboxypeptidase-like regulatory domain-containing protein [Bryobacteraceae bacterium]|nr:carboxypeptidase-like regulatory domain-containing protein [Bryobacteraceae bacterium]
MMRNIRVPRLLLGLISSVLLLPAQRLTWYERMILLPEEHSVSGRVVDPAGEPIAGAHIDHSDVKEQEQLFTDEMGRFHVETRALALVIRKRGYNGQIIRTGDSGPVRVVLQRATPLPDCKTACITLKGSHTAFCLPAVPGIQFSEQGRMGDSVMREFMVPTVDGPREILFGSGPTWSLGIPYTGDVWESADYSERSYTAGDSDVIDARGKTAAGKLWRYVGTFGESASYYEVDPHDAALPDRFLDGACAAGGAR